MKNSKVLKVILFISGLVAIGVGAAILVAPVSFYASSGIGLNGNVSLLNEIRASGGMILVVGLVIMSGVFVARLTYSAIIISMLLYLTYGLSRVLSIIIDGMPVDELVQVVILEIVIGLVCAYAFIKYRVNNSLS